MSSNSRKGYVGEVGVLSYLREEFSTGPGFSEEYYRPRAGMVKDRGDIEGFPHVHSVKNCRQYTLSTWVDDLARMCENANKPGGVVWAHRKGKGHAKNWYVITSGELFVPIYRDALAYYALGEGDQQYEETPYDPAYGDARAEWWSGP